MVYININKKIVIIWNIILLLLTMAIVVLYYIANKISLGRKVLLDKNELNISSYYTEYEATIISNKNTNTYFIKEWYKEGTGSKIEYLDYMGNTVSVISTPAAINIVNEGNKSIFYTKGIADFRNVLSLSTYVNIYNNNITCGCSKNVYEKNGEINVIYEICDKENCIQSTELKHIGVTGFELNIKDNLPKTYIVYTGNKEEHACIVYNKFNANILIEESVFSSK